ncbi:MAG: baseplate J/gp47 family protein [Caulobacteraceae bacterium]
MAFQLKNFTSIAAAILNRFRGSQSAVTDFNIGSVNRTMFEAVSAEIDELYQQMFNGLMEGIATSVFNSFSFAKLPATPASGLIRVTIAPNPSTILIPAGTVFSNTAIANTYVTQADATIAAGNTFVDVLAVASTAGAASNLNANVSFTCGPAPAGFVSAVSLAAFLNGRDLETDDQRKQRFGEFVQNLTRGTVSALEYGAMTTVLNDANGAEIERVALVEVIEPYVTDNTQPIAQVNMFIHNGVGDTSTALVNLCTQIIDGYVDANGSKVAGWKAAGVPVTVAAAVETPLNVSGVLTPAPGFDGPTLNASAQGVLGTYILGLGIGQTFLFSDAIVAVKGVQGVSDFVFSTPTANDVTPSASAKFMPGTFAITNPATN